MKSQLLILQEQLGAKKEELGQLLDIASGEKRGLNETEKPKYEALKAEIRSLTDQIAVESERESLEADKASRNRPKYTTGGEEGERKRALRQFSFVKAIRSAVASGEVKDGIEKELVEEAHREAREANVNMTGNVAAPSWVLYGEKRDLNVGTAADGGNTVETSIDSTLYGPLNPMPQAMRLGATSMTGLVGNVDLVSDTATPVATWEGEVDSNADDDAVFAKITLSPKRLGANTLISKQLLAQSSFSIEQYVRGRLRTAIELGVDLAAINGSGTAPVPTGILNMSGTNSVAMGTNGAVPTRAKFNEMVRAILEDNADLGALAWLTTPGVVDKAMNTLLDSGSGRFILENWGDPLLGFPLSTSTQVPSNLTKGTSSGVCHAAILGVWSQLLIPQWAGIDLVVDPYSNKKTAQLEITINSWWDINTVYKKAFCVVKDLLLA